MPDRRIAISRVAPIPLSRVAWRDGRKRVRWCATSQLPQHDTTGKVLHLGAAHLFRVYSLQVPIWLSDELCITTTRVSRIPSWKYSPRPQHVPMSMDKKLKNGTPLNSPKIASRINNEQRELGCPVPRDTTTSPRTFLPMVVPKSSSSTPRRDGQGQEADDGSHKHDGLWVACISGRGREYGRGSKEDGERNRDGDHGIDHAGKVPLHRRGGSEAGSRLGSAQGGTFLPLSEGAERVHDLLV
jgi:hypothetical protein